ncbi:MAG: hypothetical protein H0X51_02405 [Parachlamydiaceae bacterium]|nr:hypothetical protein [Parachlamydiaceae bacterium]
MRNLLNFKDMDSRYSYNVLRLSQVSDPDASVEPWRIADYRVIPQYVLFEQLSELGVDLDRTTFSSLSEEIDTPEELTQAIILENGLVGDIQEKVYLLLFELWRRLVPEKQSFSIFCDELDHQIDLYYHENVENVEVLQDTVANMAVILDDNTDQGTDPLKVFSIIESASAHDVESFIYDFIADQIDNKNDSYATELLDEFEAYMHKSKWFELLQARVLADSDPEESYGKLRQIVKKASQNQDLEFNYEVLFALVQEGDRDLFLNLVTRSLPLISNEEEFQDLLIICAEFLHYHDQDSEETKVLAILKQREQLPLSGPVDPKHSHFAMLLHVLKNPTCPTPKS